MSGTWSPPVRWKLAMRKPRATIPTTLDIAWAAGIYEGEGSCGYKPLRRGAFLYLTLTQKDPEITNRLKEFFGESVYRVIKSDSWAWTWYLGSVRAHGFLMTIFKFMSARRKFQISNAIKAEAR